MRNDEEKFRKLLHLVFLFHIGICCLRRTEEIIPAYVSPNICMVHVSDDEKVKCVFLSC